MYYLNWIVIYVIFTYRLTKNPFRLYVSFLRWPVYTRGIWLPYLWRQGSSFLKRLPPTTDFYVTLRKHQRNPTGTRTEILFLLTHRTTFSLEVHHSGSYMFCNPVLYDYCSSFVLDTRSSRTTEQHFSSVIIELLLGDPVRQLLLTPYLWIRRSSSFLHKWR